MAPLESATLCRQDAVISFSIARTTNMKGGVPWDALKIIQKNMAGVTVVTC